MREHDRFGGFLRLQR